MNLAQARVVLRPRSIAEIIDLGLRFTVRARGLFARLALLTIAPAGALLLALFEYDVVRAPYELWIAALLVTPWIVGVYVVASSRLLFEAKPTVRAILRHFLGRVVPFTIAALIALALIAGGAVFAIGAPVMAALTLFHVEAALLEGQGPFAALGRAKRLITHHFGTAFAIACCLALTSAMLVAAAEWLGHGVVEFILQLGRPFGDFDTAWISAYTIAGYLLSLPLIAAIHFLAYIDLRTRQDGWDLQVRFMGLAAQSQADRDDDDDDDDADARAEDRR